MGWPIGKDPDAGKDWRREEKGPTGWDGWMASPAQWTWIWVNSGSWWWTGRAGVLRSMRSRRVRHDWASELFSSSLLSAIRVVSSAYLRLLIFLLEIFIAACASSSPAFLMMYSAHKLNKQGDNIQPWCTPFPIWNQSVVPCPVLTVASWLAYRFLRRQVRWPGISISWRTYEYMLRTVLARTTLEVEDISFSQPKYRMLIL